MRKCADMITRHLDGILGHWIRGTTNAFLEGLNSVFSAVKRKARGFRSSDNLITMLYFTAGKLDLPVTLRYLTVDDTPHALDCIEPADASRVRLVFAGPAPELRDRVLYVLVDGANREPVRASSGAPGGRELIMTRVYW